MPVDDPHLGLPRHERVSRWIREQIETGDACSGAQLPSEHALGARFGVSRVTVRRALQTLDAEGLIVRRQGLGSFVAGPRVAQGLVRLTDFAQDMERAGLAASSRVLHHATEACPTAVAERLGVAAGAPVTRLDRLRLGDGEPVALDRTWLPPYYAQLLEGHDLTCETIYGVLERDYGIPVLGGRYRIEATGADAETAAALGLPRGRALLLIERVSRTVADRAVYFQRRYYRSDRIAFELELARDPAAARSDGMPLREFEPVFRGPTARREP